jgi:hypothetical protein
MTIRGDSLPLCFYFLFLVVVFIFITFFPFRDGRTTSNDYRGVSATPRYTHKGWPNNSKAIGMVLPPPFSTIMNSANFFNNKGKFVLFCLPYEVINHFFETR